MNWYLGKVATPERVFDPGAVGVEGGTITYAGPAEGAPRGPADPAREVSGWVTPGLIDLHVHGAGGRSLMEPDPEAVRAVSRTLAAHGTTGFLSTAVVSRDLRGNRHLEVSAELTEAVPEDGAQVLGIHLEGPYVNPRRGGLIRADRIWPPDRRNLDGLLKLMRGRLRMMTLAPELPGALELLAPLRDAAAVGSLGHTEATFEEARAGFSGGVRHVTHLYNAMRGLHHREPGALGAVLLDHAVTAQIIADGVHVHPELLRWTARALSPEALALITDALPSAGWGDGRYAFDGRSYEAADGTAWEVDEAGRRTGKLFGTTLLLDELVGRAMALMELPFERAVAMASLNPARTLGLERRIGLLAPGREANLVLWSEERQVEETVLRGKTVWKRKKGPEKGASPL